MPLIFNSIRIFDEIFPNYIKAIRNRHRMDRVRFRADRYGTCVVFRRETFEYALQDVIICEQAHALTECCDGVVFICVIPTQSERQYDGFKSVSPIHPTRAGLLQLFCAIDSPL